MPEVVQGIQPVSAYARASYSEFEIGICEIGNKYTCCYACLCPCCAVSQARSTLDQSTFLFNVCCISPVVERWMIRTAYGIPGGCYSDCFFGLILQPCSANQLLQTTKAYGPVENGGRYYNKGAFQRGIVKGDCCSCLYAMCCNQCAVATALERGVGMPCCMGLLCTNLFSARNIIRYQYRIAGNDLWDECVMPLTVYTIVWIASYFIPPLCLVVVPIISSMTTNLLNESSYRGSGHQMRYLSGYIMTREELAMAQLGGERTIVEAEAAVRPSLHANIPLVSVASVVPEPQQMDRGFDGDGTNSIWTAVDSAGAHGGAAGGDLVLRDCSSSERIQQVGGGARNEHESELDSTPVAVVQARPIHNHNHQRNR